MNFIGILPNLPCAVSGRGHARYLASPTSVEAPLNCSYCSFR
jgi:hypothetical protein